MTRRREAGRAGRKWRWGRDRERPGVREARRCQKSAGSRAAPQLLRGQRPHGGAGCVCRGAEAAGGPLPSKPPCAVRGDGGSAAEGVVECLSDRARPRVRASRATAPLIGQTGGCRFIVSRHDKHAQTRRKACVLAGLCLADLFFYLFILLFFFLISAKRFVTINLQVQEGAGRAQGLGCLSARSGEVVTACEDGDLTSSLGSLFLRLAVLTVIQLLLLPSTDVPWFDLCSLFFILSSIFLVESL